MSDMITRVAKAICVASGHPWEFAGSGYRETCIDFARAALDAMREPTPEMVSAGMGEVPEDGSEYEDVEDAWRAMIDAALSQDTHSLPSEDR